MATLDFLLLVFGLSIPLLIGAIPALLPLRTSLSTRVIVFALLLAASLWINEYRADPRHGWHLFILIPLWAGLLGSLVAMIVRAMLARDKRREEEHSRRLD